MNSFLSCPTDCSTPLLLPAIEQVQNCTNYKQAFSQISDLIIVPDGAPDPLDLTGAPDAALVAASIDNMNVDNTKSRHIVGEGGVAAPEKITDEYPKRQSRTVFRTYTLTFNIKNLTDAQYEFLRALQCGWTGFSFYYANVGGHLFGDAGGILPASVDVDFPLAEGRDDKEIATLTITWDADGDPPRYNKPADMDSLSGISPFGG